MVDSSGNFEGEASILHAWLCNSSSNDEGDTDMEEFVEEVIQYIKMAHERINNSNGTIVAKYDIFEYVFISISCFHKASAT